MSWQEQVKELEQRHKEFVRDNGELKWKGGRKKSGWSLGDTAKALNISKGKVSNDLRLAKALKGYKELKNMSEKQDAISFLKGKGSW